MSNIIYKGYYFKVEPLQPAVEILIAELGYAGFESFVETEEGVTAYIQKDEWNENILEDIQILKLEEDNNVPITITGIDFPVNLRGKVDRVEKTNGITRIIDYKTGNVDLAKVTVKSWDDLNTDYDKYSKSFQILQYAYMMHLKTPFLNPIEAGIISFKNLKSGFLPFNYNKNTEITTETFKAFSEQLEQLIKDICNPNIPFVEKELKDPFKG